MNNKDIEKQIREELDKETRKKLDKKALRIIEQNMAKIAKGEPFTGDGKAITGEETAITPGPQILNNYLSRRIVIEKKVVVQTRKAAKAPRTRMNPFPALEEFKKDLLEARNKVGRWSEISRLRKGSKYGCFSGTTLREKRKKLGL